MLPLKLLSGKLLSVDKKHEMFPIKKVWFLHVMPLFQKKSTHWAKLNFHVHVFLALDFEFCLNFASFYRSFVEIEIFRKLRFFSKIEIFFKIEIFQKMRFFQNWNFSKIEIFSKLKLFKNWDFSRKLRFFLKLRFFSKIEIFAKSIFDKIIFFFFAIFRFFKIKIFPKWDFCKIGIFSKIETSLLQNWEFKSQF